MKLLFLLSYYYPETAASLYLFQNLIQKITAHNNSIDLIVPKPTRGIEKRNTLYKKAFKNEKLYDGRLKIVRFYMFPEGKNTISRGLRYFLSLVSGKKRNAKMKGNPFR